jgi:hypothetical protein
MQEFGGNGLGRGVSQSRNYLLQNNVCAKQNGYPFDNAYLWRFPTGRQPKFHHLISFAFLSVFVPRRGDGTVVVLSSVVESRTTALAASTFWRAALA